MKQKLLALFILGYLAFGFAEVRAQSTDQVALTTMQAFVHQHPQYKNDFTEKGAAEGMMRCTVPQTMKLVSKFATAGTTPSTSLYPAPVKSATPAPDQQANPAPCSTAPATTGKKVAPTTKR